jgi:prevent-host-death family protein
MEKVISISELQSKAEEYVDQLRETDQPVVITQRGRAAAVLVSYDAFEGCLATWDEMGHSDWDHRIRRARAESGQGKHVTLDAYVKRRARR